MDLGQKVVLRELRIDDLAQMAEYANNEKLSVNLRDAFPSPYTAENELQFLQTVEQKFPKTLFAIEYMGQYVGNIGLERGTDVYRNSAELGYFIGEPFWNKGITTQAVKLISDFAFNTLGVVRIYCCVFEFNKGSQRVLEKAGFEKEGVFRKAVTKKGMIWDEVRYAKVK